MTTEPIAIRPVPEGYTLKDPRMCRLIPHQTALWEYVHGGLPCVPGETASKYRSAKSRHKKLTGLELVDALKDYPLPARRTRWTLMHEVMELQYGYPHHTEFYMAVRACKELYEFEQEWLIEEVRRCVGDPVGKYKDKATIYKKLWANWRLEEI